MYFSYVVRKSTSTFKKKLGKLFRVATKSGNSGKISEFYLQLGRIRGKKDMSKNRGNQGKISEFYFQSGRIRGKERYFEKSGKSGKL